ncbi:MAG: hypothetical protein ACMG6S_06730 [Byssovorax sp.]
MGTLICTVELSKKPEEGIKVTIDNKDAGITQTIQMDGTSVTIIVKKGEDESSYTQTATSVAIKCKTFEVTAEETITMTSTKKGSTYKSGDALTVQSVKDLTLTSEKADMVATAKNITATGATKVALAMANNTLELAEAGVTLSSSAKTAISGGIVAVDASATLTIESTGPATLKGAIANVQGTMVNLG